MPGVNHPTRRVLSYLSLLLPLLFYLSVLLFWQSQDLYGITGDEPHYLLIADSLYRDRDLLVENNYSIRTPVHLACKANLSDPEDIPRHVRNGYSMHNIGLPLLLIAPYALAGPTGAKVFMVLVAGLWPFLLYRAALQIIESKPWSMLIALTLSLGLPYLAASNQIYIDLVGGMIILYAAERIIGILRGRHRPFSSFAGNLCFGLLVGYLPWLHIRLSAPALLLLLGYLYAAGIRAEYSGAHDRRRLLVPALIVVGSLLLLAIYNRMAFGNAAFGPYFGYLSFEIGKILMTFTGLHFDMAHGLFMQQPLLLLGLVGVVPLMRENREAALLLLLLFVSVLLPNSMLSLWYGGGSFAGRYQWPVVSLWVFPLAAAVKLLFEYRKTFILPLCVACILLQGWMASRWLINDGLLMNTGWPLWAARNYYSYRPWLVLRLPFFKNVNDYENFYDNLRQPANYVCLMLAALLITSGRLWQERKKRHLLTKIWPLFLVAALCLIAFVPPSTPYWSLRGDLIQSQTGTPEDKSIVAREGRNGAGFLIYGPYVMLIEGEYGVTLEYESGANSRNAAAPAPRFDVSYDLGRRTLGEMILPPSATGNGKFHYRFAVDKGMAMKEQFECRVWYTGSGDLIIKRLTIDYLHP
jgi:hypothetical protein